ncbi:MAG: hypothetical protein ACYCOS_06210 [Sulfobacillus sp.]
MAAAENLLICPDCGRTIPLPGDAKANDLVECPDCAGILFRLLETNGQLHWTWIQMVSCPGTEMLVDIVHGTPEGTVYHCNGRPYILTYAFGSYALEESPQPI